MKKKSHKPYKGKKPRQYQLPQRDYDNPIISRDDILKHLKSHKPQAFQALAKQFDCTTPETTEALRRRLRAMARDGQLECDSQGRYFPGNVENLVEAVVEFGSDGNAFIDHHNVKAIIPARQRHWVFPGDVIKAKLEQTDYRQRAIALVVEVMEHNTRTIVGRYQQKSATDGAVIAEDVRLSQEIQVPVKQAGAAKDGQLVVIEMTAYPTRSSLPQGKVIEVIGDKLPAALIINNMIELHQLPHRWPSAVLAETEQLPDTVDPAESKQRRDIRQLPLVTIDGADAKDFDDAVYCEAQDKGGWRLVVAIADVSHYVRPETALDDEAYQRSTSVYFPEQVVPMLPEALSNGLCSLKPQVDRLCLVCDMQINANGKRTRQQFYPAVMYSHARLTYNKVHAYLQGEADLPVADEHKQAIATSLKNLQAFTQQSLQQRDKRGALDFDTLEPKIQMDKNGFVTEVIITERNFAHRLIEECMLQANTAAAEFLQKTKTPCLYRIHDGLKEMAGDELSAFLSLRGLHLTHLHNPDPKELNQIIKQAHTRPDFQVIQMMLLRSLNRAMYSPDNIGHFGLAYDAYTHFTSPIRRYPDLVVHRAIKHLLDKKDRSGYVYDETELDHLGEHTSSLERRADEASRDVIGMLKCVYMEDKLGQEFAGVISGVTNFGFFVTITDLLVDGLVHVTTLQDDFYRFDSRAQTLIGERSNRHFSLGQKVEIQVAQVNTAERKIDFQLLN